MSRRISCSRLTRDIPGPDGGRLTRRRANLRYVADRYLGAENPITDKASQRADWTLRPLLPEMVEYALADSRVLLPLSEELSLRLEADGMGSYPGLEGDAVFALKWVEGEWYRDGRLYADYKPLVSTGRQSCQNPPLQQMPKRSHRRFRKAFQAPEGRTLVIADFKMVELVVGAEIAGEPEMQKVFKDPEALDLHTKTALEVFEAAGEGLDPKKLKELRDRAKIVNFGIFYGMSPSGLRKTFKEVFGLDITLKQAQGYIDRVMSLYKSVARWQEGIRVACLGQGKETAATPLGRKRILPAWESSGAVNVNAAFNHPVQGGAADALKLTIGKLYRYHRELPGNTKLVGMVHDEVMVECDEEEAVMVREDLERIMVEAVREAVGNPDCPVAVEIDVRPTWGE